MIKSMKKDQYKTRPNVVLKNKVNGDTVTGNIVDEKDIDGRLFWVVQLPQRGDMPYNYAKDSWSLLKGK